MDPVPEGGSAAQVDDRITLENGENGTLSGVRLLNSTGDGIQLLARQDGTIAIVRCCLHEM